LSGDKLKVLMLLREDVEMPSGGMGVHVINIIKYLKNDFDITIGCLACDQVTLVKKWNDCRLLKIGCENTINNTLEMPLTEEIIEYNILMKIFSTFMKDWKFDIIHIHDSPFWFWVSNLLAPYYNSSVVMTVHLSYFLSITAPDPMNYAFEFYSYHVQKEGQAINYCDNLVTVSKKYANSLKTLLINGKKIHVIPNGVNYDELNKVKYDKKLKEIFTNGRKLAVFVGRTVWTKGIDMILDIVSEFPDYNFVFISNISPTLEPIVPLIGRIIKLMDEYDNLIWLRDVDDEMKFKIMKVADVGLMPSIHEPFGIVALEWMALGIPLIVSNLVPPCNDDNSILIEPNSEALAAALRKFDPDTYPNYKRHNGKMNARKHSWDATASKLKEVYVKCR